MPRVLYMTPDGALAVVCPTPEALAVYGIDAIAQKDVPHGLAYKIVDDSAIPADRMFRNAWEVDPALLTDGVGAESNEFPPPPPPPPPPPEADPTDEQPAAVSPTEPPRATADDQEQEP